MKTTRKYFVAALLMIAAGCGSNQIQLGKPWQIPEPTGPEDALIIGFVIIGDKGDPLTPEYVRILGKGKVYGGMGLKGIGEKTDVSVTAASSPASNPAYSISMHSTRTR